MKIWQKGVEILSIFDSDPQRLLSVKIIYIQLLTQRGMPQINVLRPVQDGNKFLYLKLINPTTSVTLTSADVSGVRFGQNALTAN